MGHLKKWILPPVLVGLAGLILCGLNPHGYNAILTPLHLIARGAERRGRRHPDVDLGTDPGEGYRFLRLL